MSCGAGFISIVDTFLLPDGSDWTGSITYTLLYATTAAGATLIQARQNINVSAGINICLAPGLYDVVYNQSGQDYPVSSQWNVPAIGGPLTIAAISAGVFPPVSAAGSSGQIQFNSSGVFGADSTFTFSPTTQNLSLGSGGFLNTTGHLIGSSQTGGAQVAGELLYVGAGTATGGSLAANTPVRAVCAISELSGVPTLSSLIFNAGFFQSSTTSAATGPLTNTATGGLLALRGTSVHSGSGLVSLATAVQGSVTGSGPVTTARVFRAIGPSSAANRTDHIGLSIGSGSAGGVVTNHYGVHVEALTVGTNRFSFYAVADSAYFGGGIQSPLTTPASSAATGTAGQIEWDAGFVYVCTATNTWKRAALVAF